MLSAVDQEHMARALRLARHGLCNTDPNPTVGCVIVDEDRILAEGWTSPAGGPHAERVALDAAGAAARGACVYVSLEPCSHFGRTAPCSQALIEAGVGRVVCAMLDPNPLVAGKGVAELRGAGIDVEVGVLEVEAERINAGFFSRMRRGRPWVRSKIAASLDGRTALANGVSQWITSAEARSDGHAWRARSSAVMTGSGTILADDPSLDARPEDAGLEVLQPIRVIIDSALRTPIDAKTLRLPGDVHIFTTSEDAAARERLVRAGAHVHGAAGGPKCDLANVMAQLADLEINDVWVEAGAGLNGALIRAGMIDELVLYFAPVLLGDSARGMFALGHLELMAERIELVMEEIRVIGTDLRVIARPITVAAT